MIHFTVKEASEKLNISPRAVRKRCEKNNVIRKNGSYSIPGEILLEWQQQINLKAQKLLEVNFQEILQKELVPQKVPQTDSNATQTQQKKRVAELEKELIAIKLFAKTLDESYQELKTKKQIPASREELQNEIDLKELALMGVADRQNKIAALHTKQSSLQLEIKKLEIENKLLSDQVKKDEGLHMEVKTQRQKIKNLEDRLEPFKIAPHERMEVFTNSQYIEFETKLKEWHTLQKDIEYNEKLFAVEKKGLKERSKHYKQQYEYQQKQSTRILDMHQKLLDTIDKQSNLAIQRNVIEAIEKEVINKDWKPNKK